MNIDMRQVTRKQLIGIGRILFPQDENYNGILNLLEDKSSRVDYNKDYYTMTNNKDTCGYTSMVYRAELWHYRYDDSIAFYLLYWDFEEGQWRTYTYKDLDNGLVIDYLWGE